MAMIEIIRADYEDVGHCEAIADLISDFSSEPMFGGVPLDEAARRRLIEGLTALNNSFVLFAIDTEQGESAHKYIGILVAFESFATFVAQPLVNIHDIYVAPMYRGSGVGRQLMHALYDEARQRHCSTVTLEVLNNNFSAKALYSSEGFADTPVPHLFWKKSLTK